MRRYLVFITLIFFGSIVQAQNKYPQDYFQSPLAIPLISSGTFGELRGNHFHSGLDIKTQGRIGQSVLAAAEGTIVRVKVSPYGFGRALYLRHPNGFTTVYAHLHEFNPEIEAWVVSEMKRLKKNSVDLFPPAGKFNYAQGETIAKAGNSGGSGGPHLHFEVRDTRTEKIINPLLFGFDIADTRAPEIGPLQVYYFQGQNQPLGQKEYRSIAIGKGKYGLAGSGVVEAKGPISFGLYSIDKQDGANNKNGVYGLRLFVGGDLEHEFKMETFAFAETRYINAHIDYGLKACCNRSSHRLYLEPGNALSAYPRKAQAGHIRFAQDTVVPIRIEVLDVAGNVSTLEFELHYTAANEEVLLEGPNPERPAESGPVEEGVWIEHEKADLIQGPNYELGFKSGTFYRDFVLEISSTDIPKTFSPLFQFSSLSVPVHRYYDLSLRVQHLPKGVNPQKLFIASYKEGKYVDYEGGTYKDGWVKCRTRQLGAFTILADTTSPSIKAINFKPGGNLPETLSLRVSDTWSGVDDYSAFVNDEWIPVYYDAKTSRILIKTKHWPELEGSKFVLKLVVKDAKGNVRTKKWELLNP